MKHGETKRMAFKRIATRRVNNIIRDLKLVGNLSNTNNYSFGEDEVKTIFSHLEEELKLTKSRFSLVLNRNRKIKL